MYAGEPAKPATVHIVGIPVHPAAMAWYATAAAVRSERQHRAQRTNEQRPG
jgi:hypothetical protein